MLPRVFAHSPLSYRETRSLPRSGGLLSVTARDDQGKAIGFVDVAIYQADEYVAERSTDSNGLGDPASTPGTIRIRVVPGTPGWRSSECHTNTRQK